jgi:hypothetical protein
MITPPPSDRKPRRDQPGWHDRLRSNFEDFEDNVLDTSNLDVAREAARGLHPLNPDRSDRLFLDDTAPIGVEDDMSMSSGPSVTRRIFRASAVFSFLVLAGVGGALAWRSYGGEAANMIGAWALPTSTSKPTAPPLGFADIQQQLKSIATDLAAVRHTVEQLGANQDQLTRKQEEMARTQEQMAKSIALQAAKQELSQKLSSAPPAKPVHVLPPPKPVQHPAQLSAEASSKPARLPPPQSLQPQDNK